MENQAYKGLKLNKKADDDHEMFGMEKPTEQKMKGDFSDEIVDIPSVRAPDYELDPNAINVDIQEEHNFDNRGGNISREHSG